MVNLLQTFATQSALAIQNARLFREIEDKSRQLEVATRHKSEFLANMSHELRTPLNAVIGFSEVLLERMFGEISEKQEEYLHDILDSGRHLLSLINDILDLSKIEAGRMELEVASFGLPAAIDNALTLVRERAGARGIALAVSMDDRLGEFRGDERKIKQVLLNLLSNAIKFTPAGGRVEVRAEPVDGHVEISVGDTGIGIAPQDQEAVFEEFRQVGTDYAMKREGTGLGLTLSRKFVELHGGRIWVESELGRGLDVHLHLAGEAMANELILIVEDNDKNRKLVRDVLAHRGYRIAEAETGEDGVRLARQLRPDLVLMDIQLPGIDGIGALREIRRIPATASHPGDGGDGVGHDAGSPGDHGRGVRRLPEQAHQPAGVHPRGGGAARPAGRSAGVTARPRLLVVDDTPVNVKLLADLLAAKGYAVSTAASGREALDTIEREPPDLVLLDVMMPGMSGYDVCRALRDESGHRAPARGHGHRTRPGAGAREGHRGGGRRLPEQAHQPAGDAGARALAAPHQAPARRARPALTRSLEQRVQEQVAQLERLGRLKRFFSPQLAELIVAGGAEDPLRTHRREITVVFLDLRGFTAFAETAEPEEVMGMLREYHERDGPARPRARGHARALHGRRHDDLLQRSPAGPRACRACCPHGPRRCASAWPSSCGLAQAGWDLGLGVGIAQGDATLGAIGFEGRWDYAAIGGVTNLAARLCAEASAGHILISQHLLATIDGLVECEPVGELTLKGFQRPVTGFNILGTKKDHGQS